MRVKAKAPLGLLRLRPQLLEWGHRSCHQPRAQPLVSASAGNTSAASEREVLAIVVLSQIVWAMEVLARMAQALSLCSMMPRLLGSGYTRGNALALGRGARNDSEGLLSSWAPATKGFRNHGHEFQVLCCTSWQSAGPRTCGPHKRLLLPEGAGQHPSPWRLAGGRLLQSPGRQVRGQGKSE